MRQIIIDIDCDEKYCGNCSGEKATDPKWASTFRIVSGCKYLGEFAYDPVCEIYYDRLDYADGKVLRCDKCLQADNEKKWEHVKEFRKLEAKYFEKFGQFPDCDACYSCQHESEYLLTNPLCEPCLMDSNGCSNFKPKETVVDK
jgi:hypothetical protein